MKKGDLLRLEAEVADLEADLVAGKASRPECSECGRPVPDHKLTAAQKKKIDDLNALKLELREKRQIVRTIKHGSPPDAA